VAAWRRTGGRFDPTVLDAMEALGYDRDFRSVRTQPRVRRPSGSAPGCAAIRLDPYLPAVTLGDGVHLDPGGIGKGLAADLVVEDLLGAGALGAMVNIGGDLAARGRAPTDDGWIVGIENPSDRSTHVARTTLRSGAVCTSSRVRRAWKTADGEAVHHLVDPSTGTPFAGDVVSVTVVAGSAWWAEALTKVLFGSYAQRTHHSVRRALVAAHALVVHDDASLEMLGDEGVFDVDATVVRSNCIVA
jgi:thiamine biosynthesis lipoprotein